ncbi:MAG: AIR synthase-related protein, partial [Gemmatimonadota bacterium]|nr:AIR synthase-related protein [Gemmatimonadota bacterium]
GLTGHLGNMLAASGAAARIEAGRVPLLSGARQLVESGHIPGGTRRNLADAEPNTHYGSDVDEPLRILLSDAQTSGGLLIAVAPDGAEGLLAALQEAGVIAARIGQMFEGPPGRIDIVL